METRGEGILSLGSKVSDISGLRRSGLRIRISAFFLDIIFDFCFLDFGSFSDFVLFFERTEIGLLELRVRRGKTTCLI